MCSSVTSEYSLPSQNARLPEQVSYVVKLERPRRVVIITNPSPLLAISTKSTDLVRLLIEAGEEVNAPAVVGIHRTALQAAAEIGNHELILLLLRAGAEVNTSPADYCGVIAFRAAAIGGYVSIANTILNHGADVNAEPALFDGRTILGGEAEYGRLTCCKLHF